MRALRAGLVFALLGATAVAAPVFRGVSYTPWGNDLTEPGTAADLEASLDAMRDVGVNWVALNVFEFQATPFSTTIAPDYGAYSTTLASAASAVKEIHERGMKVLLKPNVDVVSGGWRGDIPGTDAWFDDPNGYKAFIGRWAQWAQAHGVDGFAVGCEFEAASSNSAKWREVVAHVRSHFSDGPLVYAANWTEFASVDWWDALDYVGIDAYFPLSALTDPTVAQLQAIWDSIADGLEVWLASNYPDMGIMFTEIGYRSLDGANMAPWAWSPYGTDNVDRLLLVELGDRPAGRDRPLERPADERLHPAEQAGSGGLADLLHPGANGLESPGPRARGLRHPPPAPAVNTSRALKAGLAPIPINSCRLSAAFLRAVSASS